MENPLAGIAALPPPADAIVREFVSEIKTLRPGFILAVYLTGSIALDDFHPQKSDIDFLVFCRELPDGQLAKQLKSIHKNIGRKFKKPDLSGCYLTPESLATDDPESIKILSYHEKTMRCGKFEMAPISLLELQHHAIAVFGQPTGTLKISLTKEMVDAFLFKNMNGYWADWIKSHASFLRRAVILFLFPRFTEWVLLGMARQLYTLETGHVISKTAAGRYALDTFPEKFHSIIRQAIAIRKDERTYPFVKTYAIRPSLSRFRQTLACAWFIKILFDERYKSRSSEK